KVMPFGGGYADVEQIGIETGRGFERKYVACLGIHHHTSGTFATETYADEVLQLAVDGEVDVLSGSCRFAAQFADHPAVGVDFNTADARSAPDLFVERLLDTALADTEARQRQQRIVIALHVV